MAESTQNQDKFVLRLPDGMRDQIKEEAAKAGRSMNAEIIYRLEDSYNTDTVAEHFREMTPGDHAVWHNVMSSQINELSEAIRELRRSAIPLSASEVEMLRSKKIIDDQ